MVDSLVQGRIIGPPQPRVLPGLGQLDHLLAAGRDRDRAAKRNPQLAVRQSVLRLGRELFARHVCGPERHLVAAICTVRSWVEEFTSVTSRPSCFFRTEGFTKTSEA